MWVRLSCRYRARRRQITRRCGGVGEEPEPLVSNVNRDMLKNDHANSGKVHSTHPFGLTGNHRHDITFPPADYTTAISRKISPGGSNEGRALSQRKFLSAKLCWMGESVSNEAESAGWRWEATRISRDSRAMSSDGSCARAAHKSRSPTHASSSRPTHLSNGIVTSSPAQLFGI